MHKTLLGIEISIGSYNEFLARIIELGSKKLSSYICVANVHMLIEADKSRKFSDIVNGANLVTPDGMPLAKGIKILYGIRQERVAGMDLLPDILLASQQNSLSVFFYGGTQSMQDATRAFIARRYPQLSAVGFYSPPFRALNPDEEAQITKTINDSGAHFVMVALGCPKQEKWMASMKGRIHACMIGIGGALPVMIGMQKARSGMDAKDEPGMALSLVPGTWQIMEKVSFHKLAIYYFVYERVYNHKAFVQKY